MMTTPSTSVTYTAPFAGSVPLTAADKFAESASVKDFGAVGDAVTDDGAAISAALSWALSVHNATGGNTPALILPSGTYAYATSPNFAVPNLKLICAPGVMFKHTGTGAAFILDGGASGGGVYNVFITGRPFVQGNVNTTYGVDLRAVHHANLSFSIRDVGLAGLRTRWAVACLIHFRMTGLAVGGMNPVAAFGMILDRRDPFEDTTACSFLCPIAEQASNTGIWIAHGSGNLFSGGTSEANAVGGVQVDANCNGNTFIGLDAELNGSFDFYVSGDGNTIANCYGETTTTIAGSSNLIQGGVYHNIVNSGSGNIYSAVSYNNGNLNTGTFLNSGTMGQKHNCLNLATRDYDPDVLFPYAAWVHDSANNQRLFCGANETYLKSPGGQIVGRNSADTDVWRLQPNALILSGTPVVGLQQPAIANGSDSTVNAILGALRAHGLIAS